MFAPTTIESTRRRRRSYLSGDQWKPYRNNEALAYRVYELTHPEGVQTFAEIKREEDLARKLKPYQAAVIRLSNVLKGE